VNRFQLMHLCDVFMYSSITVQLIALAFVKVLIGESHFNPGAQMNDIEWESTRDGT
jgi:hypothetical protein